LREIPTSDPFGIREACDQTSLRLTMQLENLAERDLMPTQSLPTAPEELMYATAWIRDLPEYTSTKSGFDLECQWPDGASATACPPLRQSSIDSAAQDGLQIMEAWELELAIQLEPAANICETDLDILIDDARARLLKIRRSLRDSLASKSSTE